MAYYFLIDGMLWYCFLYLESIGLKLIVAFAAFQAPDPNHLGFPLFHLSTFMNGARQGIRYHLYFYLTLPSFSLPLPDLFFKSNKGLDSRA